MCPLTFASKAKLEKHSCQLFNVPSGKKGLPPIRINNNKGKSSPKKAPRIHLDLGSPTRSPLKLYSMSTPGSASRDTTVATSYDEGEVDILPPQQEVTISNAVKFMCGFCDQIFHSTEDITSHIIQAHEVRNTVPGMTSATLDTHGSVQIEADQSVVQTESSEAVATISYHIEEGDAGSEQSVIHLQLNDHTY